MAGKQAQILFSPLRNKSINLSRKENSLLTELQIMSSI